ncbi:septation ring formation regulator EzrA [Liquorilactobacillus capillatus DSM 19910]|uniref:Septation ring formation regulator EzrA n=1 Tax=Liquorilactobacillus capillatus DSM 19910 TaxID=1423731 RepID=A0A0R1LXE2_9LACO|nr:septation ring formation regulator EzrA [Liquorilactobacillus capillatus DSM 19910]
MEQITLAGESLAMFEETKQGYLYMVNHQLPELSEHLDEIAEANSHYHFFQVGSGLKKVELKVQAASELEEKTKSEISDVKEDNQEHQQKLSDLDKKYQELRKTLLAKNFSYGPSVDKLEENLAQIETDFDHYAEIANQGDYVTAGKLVSKLDDKTATLEKNLEQIPPLYRNLKNVFPEQLTEIETGYKQLREQKYTFKTDIEKQTAELHALLGENIINLKKLAISEALSCNDRLDAGINALYDELERELAARQKVEKNVPILTKFIEHAEKQQRDLLIELDRLNQNYTFNHNELEDGHSLGTQLKAISTQFKQYQTDVQKGEVIYSESLSQQAKQLADLKMIEEKQAAISDSVQNLWREEQEAKEALLEFDSEIHRLKREVEKLNLPGLTKEYLDYFYRVSDEIEQLDEDINKIQINMDKITKAMINIQADMDVLTEKTNDIIASSSLAELLLQYANRYRVRYPEVAHASAEAYELFNHKYDYAASLEKIATAVDKVEPGAYKRIEDEYYATSPAKD